MFHGKTHYKWPFSIAMLVITRGYYRYLSLLRCSDHFWPIRTVNLTENSLVHERAFSTSLRPCDIAAWSDCFHSPCDGHIYIYIIYLLGMIPLINHDSSEGEQWGRDEIYPDIYIIYIYISLHILTIYKLYSTYAYTYIYIYIYIYTYKQKYTKTRPLLVALLKDGNARLIGFNIFFGDETWRQEAIPHHPWNTTSLVKIPTMWGPPVISWFISPSNYSYKYHKP